MDVENGVYDEERMADEERVFRVWLDGMRPYNPNMDLDPLDKWRCLFVMANDWIIKAMSISNCMPKDFWFVSRELNRQLMEYPESGWRQSTLC